MSQDDLPQEGEVEVPQGNESRPRVESVFNHPLTRIQALVGVCAGLISISGGVISFVGLTHHEAVHGEMVAFIQDARLKRPIPAATLEILTPQNAVVTTLTAQSDGRVERRLKEGKYRVRVTHPQFVPEVRQIEVSAGERSEIRVGLAARAPAPAVVVTNAAPPRPPEPVAITAPRSPAPATKSRPLAARAEAVKRAEPVKKRVGPVKNVEEPGAVRLSQPRESP